MRLIYTGHLTYREAMSAARHGCPTLLDALIWLRKPLIWMEAEK